MKSLVWLGTRTARFAEMTSFAQKVLGLQLKRQEEGIAVFALPNGDTFEIFDERHPGGGHPEGVAGGFHVDDAEAAAVELRAGGIEVSELGQAGEFQWAYFRAPDGNLYEVTSGPY